MATGLMFVFAGAKHGMFYTTWNTTTDCATPRITRDLRRVRADPRQWGSGSRSCCCPAHKRHWVPVQCWSSTDGALWLSSACLRCRRLVELGYRDERGVPDAEVVVGYDEPSWVSFSAFWGSHEDEVRNWLRHRRCKDCGGVNFDDYMVRTAVWRAAHVPGADWREQSGRLHLRCLSTRLGRVLTLDDLMDVPINQTVRSTLAGFGLWRGSRAGPDPATG